MDVREKLVELLCNLPTPEFVIGTRRAGKKLITAGFIADHLIANGVTVQEWISVDDRLPKNSDNVLVCHNNGLVTTNAWLGSNWWFNNERNQITHWMPLPEPPEVRRND